MLNTFLVTGGNGMIGQHIHFGIKPTSKEMDITNTNSINNFIQTISTITGIIHLAALNIRDCENKPSQAIKVNIDGTINMLNIAQKLNIPFVLLSTGAVFSSKSSTESFNEKTSTSPNCIYGYTKVSAEKIVSTYDKSIIIRTGWVFGGQQKTHYKFVEQAISYLLTNNIVKGSNDFNGSPTYVKDLIDKMIYIITNNKFGIHHIINTGGATGYEIGVEIAKILNKPLDLVKSVNASDVPNSSPSRSKSEYLVTNQPSITLRNWKIALHEYIQDYLQNLNITHIKTSPREQLFTPRKKCRLCNHFNLELFFPLEPTPPANQFLEIKKHQERIPLNLCKCTKCNHIQLLEIIEPSFLYSDYPYLSSISNKMVQHLHTTLNNLITRFQIIKDDNILEIGANDGTCVKKLLELGYKNTIGIDPAENIHSLHNLPIICDFFNSNIVRHPKIIDKKFKLIFAFHCCAHIENIQDVFKTVFELLDDNGVFMFEVGYFYEVIKQNNFDVIYHEHIDYHTCYALNTFVKLNNMVLFDISKNNIQSGSIQFYLSKNPNVIISNNISDTINKEIQDKIFDIDYLNIWKSNIIKSTNEFNYLIQGLFNQGKKIAGYGASAKSTTFLYQCNINCDIIKYIIDDNILKQNKFSPGLHIPIKSRGHLLIEPVDYIVILSWNFIDDIIKNLESYITSNTRIISPFPKFTIL